MDKEAGQYAVNQHPDTIEETIEYLKSFQYNHQAIFGRSRRKVREILCDDNSEKLQVNAVNKEGVRERMSRLESHIGSLKSEMQTILKQMESLVCPSLNAKHRMTKNLMCPLRVPKKRETKRGHGNRPCFDPSRRPTN